MKTIFKTTAIAALIIGTLTAATAPQQERYRYLGRTSQGVILGTEATGPQNARKLKTIVGTPSAVLPGEADNAIVGIVIDCTAKTAAIDGLTTYLGDEQKVSTEATTEATPINAGSPNELVFAQACGGTLPTPAVWITGADKARAYALAEAKK